MAAGLLSCTNDDNNLEEQTPAGVPMTFNITVDEGTTTRADKTDWADGDKIYVFFNGLATKYLVLTYDGTAWSNASGGGTLESTDFSGLGTQTLTAVHFPVAVDVAYADSKFSFTSGGKPVYNFYLFEAGKAYTVDGTTVTASLSMGKPANMVQIHVAGIQTNVSDYTFGCSKIRPVACKSVGTDGTITEDVLQAGARLSGMADADGAVFAGRLVYPDVAKDYNFTLASNSNIYTLTRTGKTLAAGKMYNFPSLSETGGSNWAVTDVSTLYVDLGLTSGTKWAKYNVGATTETGHGNYFAWGEITGYDEGKTNFDQSSYLFEASGGYGNEFSKYTSTYDNWAAGGTADGKTVLDPEDDAAYAALGGKFRMPTQAELQELKTECTWTWMEDYNSTGINGYEVTKGTKSIFLPVTGRYWNSDHENLAQGWYWSSSLGSSYPNGAEVIYFTNSNKTIGSFTRKIGCAIRPVYAD